MRRNCISAPIRRLLEIHWEALRRAPEFRRFYFNQYLPWENLHTPPSNNIQQELDRFGLTAHSVPHPDMPFKKLGYKEIFDAKPLVCWTPKAIFIPVKADGSNWKDALRPPEVKPESQLASVSYLRITVNLSYPKKVLLKAFDGQITEWLTRKKNYKKHVKKTSISDIRQYFMAFDFKQLKPKGTYREIAREIFKKRNPSRNDEKKAENYCKEAKRLIAQIVRIEE